MLYLCLELTNGYWFSCEIFLLTQINHFLTTAFWVFSAALETLLLSPATPSLKFNSSPIMKIPTIYPPAAIVVRTNMLKMDSIVWRLKSMKRALPVRSWEVLYASYMPRSFSACSPIPRAEIHDPREMRIPTVRYLYPWTYVNLLTWLVSSSLASIFNHMIRER